MMILFDPLENLRTRILYDPCIIEYLYDHDPYTTHLYIRSCDHGSHDFGKVS